jgi:site-specific DNA recombinase
MASKKQITKPHENEYLIYSRKSTDDAENQKNSIAYQISEAIKFSKHENLKIAKVDIAGFCKTGIITERHTGFKEDADLNISEDGSIKYRIERPKFEKLVHALIKGEYRGIIFLCWDRASRNKNDDNILRKLMKLGVEIRFVQTSYDKGSSGELHMDVDGMFSQHYSRVISEKVTNTNRKMRDEGICTYRAPIGYENNGDPRNKPFDPIRAPLIKQLFEKYADGTWSLSDLAKWANNNGLTTRPVRRKRTPEEMLFDEELKIDPVTRLVTFNHIHKILTNLFYIGKVLGNDGVYVTSTSHSALIDEELFYRVQGLLNTKKVSIHYKEKLYFAYRGLIRCEECRRAYTPYEQKGIDYYGVRCRIGCTNSNKNLNATQIEEKVSNIMLKLSFTTEEMADIDNQVRNDVSTLEDKRTAQIKILEQEKRKLRDDLSYLRKNKLSLLKNGVYTGEDYLSEESAVAKKLENLRNQEEASDISMQEVIKDVVFLSELLKDAYLYYTLAKPPEKQRIITKIFSELTMSGKTMNYKCKNGFKVFEGKKTLLCDEIITNARTFFES